MQLAECPPPGGHGGGRRGCWGGGRADGNRSFKEEAAEVEHQRKDSEDKASMIRTNVHMCPRTRTNDC